MKLIVFNFIPPENTSPGGYTGKWNFQGKRIRNSNKQTYCKRTHYELMVEGYTDNRHSG